MSGPKDREKEARIVELAKAIFIKHCLELEDEQGAFEMAELFDDLAQARWKEVCK